MLIAAFFGSALIWAFICALAAIIVGPALDRPASLWKRVLVGAVVGAVFGFVLLYLLVSLVAALGFLFTLLTPEPLDRYALALVTTLLMAGATTLAAIAVSAFADRSAAAIRRCVLVGAAFGLVVGIANSAIRMVASTAAIPVLEDVGLLAEPGTYWALITAVQVIADIALAIAAYRLIRARRAAAPSGDLPQK